MLDNVELVQTLEDTKSKAVEVIISSQLAWNGLLTVLHPLLRAGHYAVRLSSDITLSLFPTNVLLNLFVLSRSVRSSSLAPKQQSTSTSFAMVTGQRQS